MRLSCKRNPGVTSYTMSHSPLAETKSFTYLGVTIHQNLGWENQVDRAVTKATRILNFIKRNFHMCFKTVKERLYVTLVKPHLQYGTAAWNSHKANQITSLEMVQRRLRAARFVCGDYSRTSSVSSMLVSLGWDTLQSQRQIH